MSQLLFELPLQAAARAPDRVALSSRGQTLDYATLASRVEQFAAALIRLGIGKLERIALYLPKQTEIVVGMFGAARAGCVFVPVSIAWSPTT